MFWSRMYTSLAGARDGLGAASGAGSGHALGHLFGMEGCAGPNVTSELVLGTLGLALKDSGDVVCADRRGSKSLLRNQPPPGEHVALPETQPH